MLIPEMLIFQVKSLLLRQNSKQSLKATQTQRLTYSFMIHAKIAMVVHGENAHRIQVGITKHSTLALVDQEKNFLVLL